jgi:ABC-type transport system involved in cytochrome bd biosynthesis fused ATPase/permease subunit
MTTEQQESNQPNLKLEALKFYRSEITLEFTLLGQRVSWFVMVQSFLITAFAISTGYKNEGFNWFSKIVLPLIGMLTALVVIPGVTGASDTIDLWLRKQRKLLRDHRQELEDFINSRDELAHLADDKIHTRSHYFARYLPLLTFVMWLAILILAILVPIKIL